MNCLTLLINDSDLRLMEDAHILAGAPGYVYQKGDVLLTGQAASKRSRLEPLHTNSQFWRQLHAQRLLSAIGSQQSAADFAYQQINSIWNEAKPNNLKVIISIPGSLSAEHAKLLLGIAQACPFETTALVDTAIVEIAGVGVCNTQEAFYHLDIHLHSSLITRVILKSGQYHRDGVQELSVGVEQLKASLMRDIASAFVKETRFDPLRSAETEQALFDQLPALLTEATANGTANITIQSANSTHQLNWPATAISRSLQQIYTPVIEALKPKLTAGGQLVIADRMSLWLAAMEGLLAEFANQIVHIEPTHTSAGIAQTLVATSAHQAEENGIPWVTHLPASDDTKPFEVDMRPPSHLLIGTTAFALDKVVALGYQEGSGFSTTGGKTLGYIRLDDDGICLHNSDQSLTLNGTAITNPKTTLQSGDVLKCEGYSARCIVVESE